MSSHAAANPAASAAKATGRRKIPFINGRTTPLTLGRFCEVWQSLQSAGVAPRKALPDLADAFEPISHPLATTLDSVDAALGQGSSLEAAFAKHEKVVGENMVAAVALGEKTGTLDTTLGHLAKFFRDVHKARQNLFAVIAEPLLFSFFAIVAGYVIVVEAVPKFEDLYRQSGDVALPWPTLFLVWLSELVRSTTGLVIAGIVMLALAASIAVYLKNERVRFTIHKWSLKVPGFGTLILSANLANAFRAMALSWKTGGDAPESIRRGGRASANLFIRDRINWAADQSRQGRSVEDCFRDTKIMPPISMAMLRVGEGTGQMPELLDKLADSLLGQVDFYRERIQQFMDPAMKVIFGGIALFMMLALFMPMWNLVNAMSNRRPDPSAVTRSR